MTQGIVFQLEQVCLADIQYANRGELSGYIIILYQGDWFLIPIGLAFMNLGFNTTLSTLENPGEDSTELTFRCDRQEGIQRIQIGDLPELLVPLDEFNTGVAKALGVVALPV